MQKSLFGSRYGQKCLMLVGAAVAALGITGCLRNKMASTDSIRSMGANARYLDVVPVQTETGSAALCLYSVVEADSSRQVVTQQAVLPGELLTGLETMPGLEGVRGSVIADMMAPAAVVLAGVGAATAGRLLPAGSQAPDPSGTAARNRQPLALPPGSGEPFPPSASEPNTAPGNAAPNGAQAAGVTGNASGPSALLPSAEMREQARQIARVNATEEKVRKRFITSLERRGFSFADSTDTRQAWQALDGLTNNRIDFRTFITTVEGMAEKSTNDEFRNSIRASVSSARSRHNRIDSIRERILSGNVAGSVAKTLDQEVVAEAVTEAAKGPQSSARQSAVAFAKRIYGPFEKICGGNATGMRVAAVKAGLCAAGTLVAGGGVLWGAGGLAMGSAMKVNTEALQAAISADAASRPDVKLDAATYDMLISGITTYSSQLVTTNPDLASRPSCQQ